ncbi:shikimate dehydrogenase [Bosea sp. (in: a-proteobacteria)]|uniref:shikimate dehydrogenase family protein n=1 Tax=Bosea sp. (in: a-proteobacteria) TaxID=1871050 RepID=UPI002629727A|nr:shikimate dehydrogenase [Bosea sp. (in: a-proteobacteria)]MCO5090357.1 shikimate dehydrogenase [Bosea sp. (in: a-proteobacteria)]
MIYAKSPQNINPLISKAGHDAIVVPVHILQENFDDAIGGVLSIANLDGIIVTMPFKEKLLARMHEASGRARAVGAINAARRKADGSWEGDIFDGAGLVAAAETIGVDPRGLSVGLIGAGGAGSAIAFALADAGAATLVINDRDQARAEQLCTRVARYGPLNPTAQPIDVGQIDLLVHATPLGMNASDGIAIDIEGLTARTAVIDIVTKPQTALLREAALRGCPHVGGATMVQGQANAILGFLGLD